MNHPLHIRGAQVWDHKTEVKEQIVRRDFFTVGDRIVDQAAPGAIEVDLDGYTLFPGLINAHDHLELNHYPRSKFRERYDNAHQWGEDMNVRLNDEPYKSLRAYPLEDRCFIGGLKNLLCGATTVVHHNPPHKCLFKSDFPVRVLKEYGWAHSLHFDTDEEIVRSYRSTPKEWPWFIHLAEGTDEVAAGEYQRLKTLGCIGKNTVMVHGVGLLLDDICDSHQIYGYGHGMQMPIVWCPTTNMYLLGKTDHPRMGWNTQLLLGSDSRLTAQGDLLDEIRFLYEKQVAIHQSGRLEENNIHHHLPTEINGVDIWAFSTILTAMQATSREGETHGKNEACHYLRRNLFADWFLLQDKGMDSGIQLCQSRRADLALVVYDSLPRIGDPDVMAKFPHIQTVGAILDGVPKAIHIDLARRIHRCSLKEPGLEVEPLPKRGFFFT
ncbi:MAG: hypothetical protein J0M33_12535 [Anaerolineae bacterium]|nr:hypothetical protein [Anaerolineae bacterium]